ncbi:hypothetical protein BRARA_I03749 [Brassica rapa]|uniref:FBD domain-containing protein n=1 Tax=Brassica campestris TaxID=3711 RepID=A0A397Y2X7_BRACM|nr:hypothetical protein BRARA_I03749 [Brassica rapa]
MDRISEFILSKRWECLWMWLPKLEYGHRDCSEPESKRLQCFLDRNLPLHRAPVIESFRLKLISSRFKSENINLWVAIAVSHCLRELEILYESNGFVINTPALKYFKLMDHNYRSHNCLIEHMPNLIEAHLDVELTDMKSIIGSITSVKRLTMCCSQTMLDQGFVFNQLEHLDLCLCAPLFPDQLFRLLKASSKLKRLHLFFMNSDHYPQEDMDDWNQPSTVPECILSSLQSLSWSKYTGEPQEREVVVYILKHALHLKTATIKSSESEVPKFEMLKELALSSRASATCQLMFE